MKIANKIMVNTLVIVIFIFILLTAYSFYITDSAIKNKEIGAAQQKVDEIGEFTDLYFSNTKSIVESIANDPKTISSLKSSDVNSVQELRNTIDKAISNNQNIENIGIFDTSCILKYTGERATNIIGQDFSTRDYCIGVRKSNSAYISESFISAATNEKVIGVSTPIKNTDRKIVGYTLAIISINELKYRLDKFESDSYIILLDRYDQEIFRTNEKNEINEEELQVIEKLKTSQEGSATFTDSSGKEELITYKKFAYFTIIYDQDKESVFATNNNLFTTQIEILLIGILVLIIGLYFISKSISKPLVELNEKVNKISKGNLDIELPKSNIDEIQSLTDSLNRILASMKLAVLRQKK